MDYCIVADICNHNSECFFFWIYKEKINLIGLLYWRDNFKGVEWLHLLVFFFFKITKAPHRNKFQEGQPKKLHPNFFIDSQYKIVSIIVYISTIKVGVGLVVKRNHLVSWNFENLWIFKSVYLLAKIQTGRLNPGHVTLKLDRLTLHGFDRWAVYSRAAGTPAVHYTY